MRVDEWLRRGELALCDVSDSPRLDAELLLAHVTDRTRVSFRSHPEWHVSADDAERFASLLQRRATGEPIAYITGEQAFWTLTLQITPHVLVPRPETELVVERALTVIAPDAHASVLDVGTGSGAIALAIASERQRARVLATDVSRDALRCAQANATRLNLAVDFRDGDLFAPIGGMRFDVIVSNPPYIAADDPHTAPAVRRFEPHQALFSGSDGLDVIRRLVAGAPAHLHSSGWLMLEHGWQQGAQVRALLVEHGFSHVRSHADLAGHERVSKGQLASPTARC